MDKHKLNKLLTFWIYVVLTGLTFFSGVLINFMWGASYVLSAPLHPLANIGFYFISAMNFLATISFFLIALMSGKNE